MQNNPQQSKAVQRNAKQGNAKRINVMQGNAKSMQSNTKHLPKSTNLATISSSTSNQQHPAVCNMILPSLAQETHWLLQNITRNTLFSGPFIGHKSTSWAMDLKGSTCDSVVAFPSLRFFTPLHVMTESNLHLTFIFVIRKKVV